MNRKLLWSFLVIGLALVIAPFALSLPSKAASGERMLQSFQPMMAPASVHKTVTYFDGVFLPIGKVTPVMSAENVARMQGYGKGLQGMQTDAAKLQPMLGQALHMTPTQVRAMMGKQLPAMSAMLQSLPQMQRDFGTLIGAMSANVDRFGQVPAGLRHYDPLIRTMDANVQNFREVNSLPDFRLLTWFFVVPGALLVLLAGSGLYATGERRIHLHTPRAAHGH